MPIFRLNISHNERLLGYFQSDMPWAQEAVRKISACLSQSGYSLDLQVANDERRLLESGPNGLRVIGREPLFAPASLQQHPGNQP